MTLLDLSNYEECLRKITERFSGKVFNILIKTEQTYSNKYCGREFSPSRLATASHGQVCILLKPGGSIAWDLNSETVEMEVMPNGDIKLLRIFWKTGRTKSMIMTQNPI